jgi:hypothetical protein
MKNILIADATLRFASMQKAAAPTFREKVALLRELDRLSIDVNRISARGKKPCGHAPVAYCCTDRKKRP